MELGSWFDEDTEEMYDEIEHKTLQLRDWQREAKEYFFNHNNKAIFEVATGCLVGDVLIDMPRDVSLYPNGIPIHELVGKKDFYTYSFNIEKEMLELKKVKKVWKSGVDRDVYEIETLSGRKIIATRNHPFLVDVRQKPEKGCGRGKREKIVDRIYKKIEHLNIGDYLSMWPRNNKRCNGGYAQLSSEELSKRSSHGGKTHYSDKIKSIKYVGKKDVYDMEVEDNHNFLANDFIVHNSGKTFSAIDIMTEVLDKDPNIKVLVVVPKNVILETGWYKELTDFGFPIQDIGVFYGSVKEYAKVTITNMQSVDKIPLEIFDFCILDEVHNFATKRLEPLVFKDFKYKLGLSATLKRLDNKHYNLMKAFDYNIYSYTPEQALTEGVLNPFDFYNIGVDLDSEAMVEYRDLTDEIKSVLKTGGSYESIMRSNDPLKFKLLSLINKRKSLVNNYYKKFKLLQNIIRRHKKDKVIVFNQYNEQTSKLFWWLLEEDVKCRVFHSGVGKKERDEVLTDFKNDKFNVLLTSKVLDEGYNLPKLDVAIIMAGDSTDKQTVQRMGRVLRKKKGRNSVLYQLFCNETIEQTQGEKRALRFKKLASSYYNYNSSDGNIEF